VLFLHSFEYDAALAAFRQAEQADPGFVMAVWGDAMTWTHPVWDQQNADSARAALARLAPTRAARLARATTPRERAYLDAAEALYGDGSKQRRDTLYSSAMMKMVEDFPDDMEARSFAALSLLGLNQGVRDVAAYMRAAALVAPIFERNPDHPGAAHILIHAFDDPQHAPLGLTAARAYSRIAPDAAHAQHMTTHIFFALGMWDDAISQNIIAANQTVWLPGHYTQWLGYAYLQEGRYGEALRHLERVRAGMRDRPGQRASLAWMRGEYLINTERWNAEPGQWAIDVASAPAASAYDQFVRGYAAAKSGERAAGAAARAAVARLADTVLVRGDSLTARSLGVMERELRAMLMLADGGTDQALALLREATAMEDALPMDFGPPAIVKPSHELFGEVLLQLRRPADAQREFTRALALAPGRARALIGLIRSAAAAGDRPVAESAYRLFAANWRNADGDLRELAELRQLVAAR
jgi:tetratricopeptide (TPR) repeat protein